VKISNNWTLSLINEPNIIIKNLDLTLNPSVATNQLKIQPNTLDYGLYQITYQGIVKYSNGQTNITYLDTYVRIIPTGLGIFPFENGVTGIKIGSSQSINFNPVQNSFDFDNLATFNSLSFKFYCRTVDNFTGQMINFLPILDNLTDLMSYKFNSNLIMAENQNCFLNSSI
jgi:hypothetical protein